MVKKISNFSKKELDSFFKRASAAHKSQAFTILVHPTDRTSGKILPIVSKKYGNAPARNLLKRRLKSIFLEEKLYEKQKDIIVITRPAAKRLSFQDIKQILVTACMGKDS